MPVNVRWVTVNGQQQLLVTTDGGQVITIHPDTAWELITELRWCLMANVPGKPDNDQGEH